MVSILAYVGDGLSVLALSMIFSLSLAVQRTVPGVNRISLWAVPVIAVLVSFPLGYIARTWPADATTAAIVLGVRALTSSLFAILHLGRAQKR